ncbi:MAG: DUF2778 domain-containing protein [Rhodopseudomonas sp.]|nr:DUF2778 domain-containing protein [Rhodopseudomonas sp.]
MVSGTLPQGFAQRIGYGGPATLALGYDGNPTSSVTPALGPKWVHSTGKPAKVVEVPQTRVNQDIASTGYFAPVARLAPIKTPPVAAEFVAKPAAEWNAAVPGLGPKADAKAATKDVASLAPASPPAALPKPNTAVESKAAARNTKVAIVNPPPVPAKPVAPPTVHDKIAALPDVDNRTAVYDIAGHTVYMPDGQKLEAHSGLYDKLDDPRFVKVKMRGPTPPNVYDLTLREQLFHGVRAIRLNPVDESKMHGRDGMLAHTYMLGPNGQSNGCVSFKEYRRFLQAYLDGKVNRLVVVPSLGGTSWRTAAREGGVRRVSGRRYAANSEPAPSNIVERFLATW